MMLNADSISAIYGKAVHKPKNHRARMDLHALVEKQITPQPKNIQKVLTAIKRVKRVRGVRLCDITGLSISLVNRCVNVLECQGVVSREFTCNGRESTTTIVFN